MFGRFTYSMFPCRSSSLCSRTWFFWRAYYLKRLRDNLIVQSDVLLISNFKLKHFLFDDLCAYSAYSTTEFHDWRCCSTLHISLLHCNLHLQDLIILFHTRTFLQIDPWNTYPNNSSPPYWSFPRKNSKKPPLPYSRKNPILLNFVNSPIMYYTKL